jgi:hypothetical protein
LAARRGLAELPVALAEWGVLPGMLLPRMLLPRMLLPRMLLPGMPLPGTLLPGMLLVRALGGVGRALLAGLLHGRRHGY